MGIAKGDVSTAPPFAFTYSQKILDDFGVDLENNNDFKGNKGKWSERVKRCFNSFGKQWNDGIEKKVKALVAETISSDHRSILNPQKRSAIDSLVTAIEAML